MKQFYSLKVLEIEPLTSDSVKIVFDTSKVDAFKFKAGQYITVRQEINNEDVRRSYSLSSSPEQGVEIGVKRIENGLMSTFLTRELEVGDVLDVMPPTGNFYLEPNNRESHYVAICAGSGITPILSMIKTVLDTNQDSFFTLIYGNRNKSSVMFAEELRNLENDFQSQLFVHYIFSRENVNDCIKGRIDSSVLENLYESNKDLSKANSYFVCGPGELINNVSQFLMNLDIKSDDIYFERFTSGIKPQEVGSVNTENKDLKSSVVVCVDGDEFQFSLSPNGDSILDAAMDAGADVPFSCKGGVCCVCKAKVIKGEVRMDQNYSLSEDEISQGYILGCQSHPISNDVVIDFDEI